MHRVMSTQKFPMVGDPFRAKPRTSAMATAIPTAGLTNCWTVSAADLGEVRHRRFAAVVLPVGVRDERHRRVPRQGVARRVQVLRVEGQAPLEPDDQVGEEDRNPGEDDHRAGVPLPRLLLVGARPEELVDRPLRPAEEVDPAVEDRGHVRPQVPPGDPEGHDQDDDRPEEPHLEPLRLEHGDAEVDEHHRGDAEQDALDGVHYTRSRAQISPSMPTVKTIVPSTARKSPIRPLCAGRRQQGVYVGSGPVNDS